MLVSHHHAEEVLLCLPVQSQTTQTEISGSNGTHWHHRLGSEQLVTALNNHVSQNSRLPVHSLSPLSLTCQKFALKVSTAGLYHMPHICILSLHSYARIPI